MDVVDIASGVDSTAKVELCDHVFQSHSDCVASGVHQTVAEATQDVASGKTGMAVLISPLYTGEAATKAVEKASMVAKVLLAGDMLKCGCDCLTLDVWSVRFVCSC